MSVQRSQLGGALGLARAQSGDVSIVHNQVFSKVFVEKVMQMHTDFSCLATSVVRSLVFDIRLNMRKLVSCQFIREILHIWSCLA